MTGDPLPRRAPLGRRLWLPALGDLVLDHCDRPVTAPGCESGEVRLRAWAAEDGFFAAVTRRGGPDWATAGAPGLWRRLRRQYGDPVGLAEYHPESSPGGEHALLVAGECDGALEWARLYPAVPGHPQQAEMESWWAVFGREVTSLATT